MGAAVASAVATNRRGALQAIFVLVSRSQTIHFIPGKSLAPLP
jgi:hypothetical protein